MWYNCTHYLKVNPVATTLVRDPEGRWKLVAPCFWRVRIDQRYLGTEALLDMVDSLPISLPVILLPANQDMEHMVHQIKTNSYIDDSSLGPKFRQYRNKSKRSKCLKGFSNISLDNCVLPNELPDFICGDLSLANGEPLCDGQDKIEKTIKTRSKKRGKKKSKNHEKSHHGNDHISSEVFCEGDVHNVTSFSSSRIAEKSKSFTDLSCSHLPDNVNSLSLTCKMTDVKEKNGEHSLNSDLMDASGQSLNEIPTGELVICPFDKNAANCDSSKTSSTCDTVYFSSLEKSPQSDESPSDLTIQRHANDENMPDNLDGKRLLSVECQTVANSFDRICTLGNTISAKCGRDIEADDVTASSLFCWKTNLNGVVPVFEESGLLNDNEYCGSGSVRQSCIPVKRGRHSREPSGNANSSHKFGSRNTYSKMQKSVAAAPIWQRVQKNGVDRYPKRPQIPNLASEPDILKKHGVKTRNNALHSSQLNKNGLFSRQSNCDGIPSQFGACLSYNGAFESNRLDCNSKSEKVILVNKKLRDEGLVLKENATKSYTKGPGKGKPVTRLPKISIREHTAVNKSSGICYWGRQNLRSQDKANHSKIVSSSTYLSAYVSLNSQEVTETHSNQTSPPNNSTEGGVHTVNHQFSLSTSILNSPEKVCTLELQPGDVIDILDETDMISETTALSTESCSVDHFSGSKQKWVPVGKKDANAATHPCGLFLYNEYSTINENDMFSMPSACPLGYSSTALKSTEATVIKNNVDKLIEQSVQISGERNGKSSAFAHNSCSKEKILQAVTDAYGVQIASEVFYLQTGSHLAEFEKVLHSASPVISRVPSLPKCSLCSHGRLIGDSLCRRQIPNIALGTIWQWYAKHGSYGLEVKVEDPCASKLGSSSEFRAYFVPYLSAVQLFGLSEVSESVDCSNSDETRHVSPATGRVGDPYVTKRSSNCVSRLRPPLLSILLPRSHQGMPAEFLESPPQSTESDEYNMSANIEQDAGRLLFEYFESDPPQNRPPLFEKIKMLVRGGRSLNSRMFGDPSKLECLHLHDIGPASWFSVAWYPIYRIPDGSLRAAFLTYHCLGNFAYSSSEATHSNAYNMVFPAVGLQSYNSKGECWFLLGGSKSDSFQAGVCSLNPSEVLKERLRTLNQTAETMARASVQKLGHASTNRQPDYEFFVSRAW